MKLMRKIKHAAENSIVIYKQVFSKFTPKPVQNRIKMEIPYFSQWESNKLVEKIISSKVKAQNDPLWQKSGATSREEYAIWSWNMCGMACLKMILAHKFHKIYPTVKLGKKCLEYGGYRDNTSKYNLKTILAESKPVPFDCLDGMYYEPFLQFIHKEFHLHGRIASFMIIQDIIDALADHKYIIASVSPSIRALESLVNNRGGHLVLVTGYDLNQKMLYLHNPSGIYEKSQEHFSVSFKDFNKFFANRGIVIS